MALIKCPECGGEVSSSAKQCIHCGFSFKICPDCNAVVECNTEVCPECGCVLKSCAPQPEIKKQAEKAKDGSAVETSVIWDKRFAETKQKAKTVNWTKRILDVISAVLFAIAMIMTFKFSEKSTSEMINKFDDFYKGLKSIWVIDLILTIASIILECYDEAILNLVCRNTMIRGKWDLREYMSEHNDEEHYDANFDGAFDRSMKVCFAAQYWKEQPKAVVYEFAKSTLIAVLLIIAAACGGAWLLDFFDKSFAAAFVGVKFEFKDADHGLLIAAGVFVGIAFVLGLIYEFTIGNKFDKWKEEFLKSFEKEKE